MRVSLCGYHCAGITVRLSLCGEIPTTAADLMDTIMIQPTLAGTIKNANNPDLRAHFVPVGDHSPTLVPLKSMTITAAPSRRLTVPLSRLSHSKRAFPTSQRAEQAISGKNRLQSSQSEIRQRPHSRPPSPQEPINGDSTVISLPTRPQNEPNTPKQR